MDITTQYPRGRPVLVVVEGSHDIEFLKRLSRILCLASAAVPDLDRREAEGGLLWIPTGGNHRLWADRLAALQLPEFHLLDREVPPVTGERQQLIEVIQARSGCVARMTSKRAMENYLHPAAIVEAGGMAVEVGDDDDVPELLARTVQATSGGPSWESLPRRSRCRLRNRIKRWLTTSVVDRMTPALLAERDPQGEVVGWLESIGRLLEP